MATRIKDIIKYYIRHNVSDKLKERVLDRVSNTRDDGETNEVLREVCRGHKTKRIFEVEPKNDGRT